VKRALEPIDRVLEVLFGLIMVLTFTGSLSVAEAGREDVRTMLVGALGCNLAWGIIDAIFYLMGCLAEKSRGLSTLRSVREATDPERAQRLIADALPLVGSVLEPAELEAMRLRLKQLPEPPERAGWDKLRMKAITVEPKKPGSARYEDAPEPDERDGSVLVEAVAVGVCGTDAEIVEGKYGWAPPGKGRLVLGHESLGRVIDPGPRGGLKKGDLVVGIVRRPDPVPCPNCAVGEWDMCRNGEYTERGIKQIDGFMSERWRIEPEYAVKVDSSLGCSACYSAARRATGADHCRGQGVGAGVARRPAGVLGAAARARHRRRADRVASGPPRPAAGSGRARSRPHDLRAQA